MPFENVGYRVVKGKDSFCRELPKPISSRKLPLVKMDTSLSRVGPAWWLKYPLQRLENMVIQSAILLQVIFLMGKSLKILSHLLMIVMPAGQNWNGFITGQPLNLYRISIHLSILSWSLFIR